MKHRTELVSNLHSGSVALNERVNLISQGIASKTGNMAAANQGAYKLVDLAVDKQAYFLSYLDTFRLVGIFFIVVIPLVAFLRVKKNSDPKAVMKAAAEAH
jgi:DHA2 family multidrug resistance protein